MPQGYYTIEQWTRPRGTAKPKWVPILDLPFGASLTAAEQALEQLQKSGFFRIVQTQRVIWAERDAGKVRLRKSHAGSPANLDEMRKMFERCAGDYPTEEVRQARQRSKKNSGK